MDAERTTTVTFNVSVSDDDSRSDEELAAALLSAIKHGRAYTFGETYMTGVKVSYVKGGAR